MQAMIQNDEEKRWMLPLAELRNKYLEVKEDRVHREFRRMDGSLTAFTNSRGETTLVHGPYKQSYREELLRAVLKAQSAVRSGAVQLGRSDLERFQLITPEEIEEIRRIWIQDKHEIEDSVPRIVEEATGEEYPYRSADDNRMFSSEDMQLLKEMARTPTDQDDLHFQLVRELLHVEQGYRTASRRAGIYEALERALERGAFTDEKEALAFAIARQSKGIEQPVGQYGVDPETIELQLGVNQERSET